MKYHASWPRCTWAEIATHHSSLPNDLRPPGDVDCVVVVLASAELLAVDIGSWFRLLWYWFLMRLKNIEKGGIEHVTNPLNRNLKNSSLFRKVALLIYQLIDSSTENHRKIIGNV